MDNKAKFKEFADQLFSAMNVDETQKILMQNVFENTIDNMSNNDVKELENKVEDFIKKKGENKSVFD